MKRTPYGYSQKNSNEPWLTGLNYPIDADIVPASIAEANAALKASYRAEHEADALVGELQLQLTKAREQDSQALGQALANGEVDPGTKHVDALTKKLDAAQRQAVATRHATKIQVDRFRDAMSGADMGPIVAAYDAQAVAAIAETKRLLTDAKAARDRALNARELSRLFDAYPKRSRDFNYTRPIGAHDEWRSVDRIVTNDLATIAASTPLSLLPDEGEA
jgi:hypothetical protein